MEERCDQKTFKNDLHRDTYRKATLLIIIQ